MRLPVSNVFILIEHHFYCSVIFDCLRLNKIRLPVVGVGVNAVLDLLLPFVAIGQQLFFIVQQLFVGLSRVLGVGGLDDCVDRAGLLAVPAVDAFCHVDVVLGCATRAIDTLLGLDSDGLGGANSLAQLASNAPLLAGRVASQRMLTSESGRQRTLLKRVVDGVRRTEIHFQRSPHASEHFCKQEKLGGLAEQIGFLLPGFGGRNTETVVGHAGSGACWEGGRSAQANKRCGAGDAWSHSGNHMVTKQEWD